MHGFITRHLRAHETLFQTIKLVVDLLASRVERRRECRIDRLKLLPQTIELVVNILLSFCEELRTVSRQMFLDYTLDNRLKSFEEIRKRQVISFEHSTSVTLNHRQA